MDGNSEEIFCKFSERQLIGTGSNGNRVYKVKSKEDRKTYAMKKIFISESDKDKYLNEISIFKSLDHPNIIRFFESFTRKDKLYIVMEYAEKGDIKSVVKKQITNDYQPIDEQQILNWLSELVSALKYLHVKKIIHRDIKLENIFLTAENSVKLGDFGISKKLENSMELAQTGVGTPFYLSPEICQGLAYNFKTDIWMLGCFFYELCTLNKPFKSESIKVLINNIVNQDPDPLPNFYSDNLRNLILSMLNKLPEDRPNIYDISQKIIEFKMPLANNLLNGMSTSVFTKTIDKNKLKIEIEEELSESGSLSSKHENNSLTPISNNLEPTKDPKFLKGQKKFTPSYGKNDMNKIMKNLKISPMITPQDNNQLIEIGKKRTCSTTTNQSTVNANIDNTHSANSSSLFINTNNSTPTSLPPSNGKAFPKLNKNFKSRHYKQISINISSIQSPDLRAVYEVENVEGRLFPSPLSSIGNSSNKPSLTPTNLIGNTSKISPKESLVKREVPNSTKVGKNQMYQDESPIRRALMKNFLIERYTKEKFDLMYEVVNSKETFDESKIKEIIGDDYKIALNYLRYLSGNK